jgi:hypothetical protein
VGRTLTTGNLDQLSTCWQSHCCRWAESVISVRLICETVISEMLNTSRSERSRVTAAVVTAASKSLGDTLTPKYLRRQPDKAPATSRSAHGDRALPRLRCAAPFQSDLEAEPAVAREIA